MANPHPISIRMPEEIKSWLRGRADDNCRSLSKEIIALLKAAKRQEAKAGGAS